MGTHMSFNRLSFKLLLLMLLSMTLLGSATTLMVARGFGQTQREVTQRTVQGLRDQGRAALLTLTQRETELSNVMLQQGIATSQQGANYLVEMAHLGGNVPYDSDGMTRTAAGLFYDPNPARRSEVVIPNIVAELDASRIRDLRESAALNVLFPTLMAQYRDAVGMYFMAPTEVVRYYPLTDLHTIIPPDFHVTQDPSYTNAMPDNNPQRETVWRMPYVDAGGQGLIVTASTPIYINNEFRGIFAVDVSLKRLVDHLNTLKPTPGGFAFLMSDDGHLIAAPPAMLPTLLADGRAQTTMSLSDTLDLNLSEAARPAISNVIQSMRIGDSNIHEVELGGRPMFISYAPLPNIGWSLGLVAPIDELTAQAQTVSAAIVQDADATARQTVLAMIVVFLLALVGTSFFSHRMLTRPIAALVRGTRAVTNGNFDVAIPVTSGDELGTLAASFNHMTQELRSTRHGLELHRAELLATNARLQEQEAQYRSIFEATSDGLSITTMEGTIVEANPAMASMHGYRADELIGRSAAALVHPDYRQVLPAYVEAIRVGDQYQTQAVDVRKDGTEFHVEVNGSRFMYKGEPHVLGVLRDVTERVESFQLLEQRVAERTRELETLLGVSRNVTSTLELTPLLEQILQHVNKVIPYDAAAISLLDDQHTLNLILYTGPIQQDGLLRRWPMAPIHYEKTDLATVLADGQENLYAFGREVVYTAAPVIIPNVQAETPLAVLYRRRVSTIIGRVPAYIGTWMGVPLMFRDRVIGMLSFDHQQPHYYGAHHAALALAFGNQAAIAIENARLYESTQSALRKTTALAEIAGSLTELGSLNKVLSGLTERVVQATSAEACAVVLWDDDRLQMHYGGSYGLPPGYAEADEQAMRIAAADGKSLMVMGSQEPIIKRNVRESALLQPELDVLHPFMHSVTWDTIISVPLTYRDRLLGTLSTFVSPQHDPTNDDVAFLQAIASQAAVAIENATLFAEAQGKAALEERQKLARELHDSVSQALYGIALGSRTARKLLDRDPNRVAEPLDYVLSLAEAGLAEMRALIFELRPESLEQEGLVAALTKQAASLKVRHGIEVVTTLDGEPQLPLGTKEALYRIAQEALHNTVKHANATQVEIQLRVNAEQVMLRVSDNGVGFDSGGSFPGHLGLTSMRERVAKIGGHITLMSAPGSGTTICAEAPFVG